MIEIICSKCGEELKEQGGLLFCPPDIYGLTFTYHVCKECWKDVMLVASGKGGKE